MLQLKTFGGLWLTGGEAGPEAGETLPRQLILLALVAEAGERGISRDRAIAYFWPEGDEERGRRSFNQFRYTLRRHLGADPLVGTRTLRADPTTLTSDVAEFAHAIASGDAERAAALYAGPFLDGVVAEGSVELDSLIEERRSALKRQLVAVLETAATKARQRGDHAAALGYHRRLVGLDPLSTPFVIGLMNALADSGDASGALVAAAEHESVVRRELEVAPDASVAALVENIRSRTQSVPRAALPGEDPPRVVTPPAATERTSRRAGPRWSLIGLAVVLILAISAGLVGHFAPASSAALMTLLRRPSATLVRGRIAVAPLANQTVDSTLDALGAMAADWIAQGLGETGTFDVVDPRTAMITSEIVARIPRFLRPADRAVALGRETGAAISVGGALYRDGDSIRAVLRVVNTETGQVLRPIPAVAGVAGNPGGMVTALARLTVAAVAAVVDTTSAELSATLSPPPSYDAYVETSRAWESYYRSDFDEALRRLDKAIGLDSTYAPPLLLKAYVFTQWQRWAQADSSLQLVHRRGLRLTPVEQAALDVMEADVAGDLNARLLASRELARLAPASSEGAALVAGSAVRLGRNREALAALEKVDPDRGLLLFSPVYWTTMAEALHELGRFDEEIAAVRRAQRKFPTSEFLQVNLVSALAATGDAAGALREARRPGANDPFPAWGAASLVALAATELRGHGFKAIGERMLDSLADHLPAFSSDTGHRWDEQWLRSEILYQAGRWAAADSALRPNSGPHARNVAVIGRLATIDARLGRREAAERAERELGEMSPRYLHGRAAYWRARISAALGNREAAVLSLRDAFAQGYTIIESDEPGPVTDRDFLELLNDPSFMGVLRRE